MMCKGNWRVALDKELLLAHILQQSRSFLYTHDVSLTIEQNNTFQKLLKRRKNGEPLAYILGKKEFWSLELDINPEVLIPRPETELSVEIILERFPRRGGSRTARTIVDLGTGSGAIALAIATERPDWEIIATDNNKNALKIAQQNAQKLNIKNIKFLLGDWCQILPDQKFDIIVSNPPYVAANDPNLSADTRFEPQAALISPDNGLYDLKTIINQAASKLNPHGMLILEHGFNQGQAVRQLMQDNGYVDIQTHRDLSQHERTTVGVDPCINP